MKRITIPLLVLLLIACSQQPVRAPGGTAAVIDSPVVSSSQSLLEYAADFGELTADVQKKELNQVSQALAANKTDGVLRMKLAMIHGLPGSRLRDTAKAQALLDELSKDKSLDTEKRALAILLRDTLSENTKLANKARDEQKRADGLQQRADDLQQKLNELKNIERTMQDRETGVRK